ncbi:hypothetical protein TWF481_004385 [Arthrobotrys musiformis]|uniref:F-box domain-containing protein n=1 Tax=Arthrobotrys musiformis TaxID=47236 RepID=A0AAV9WKJ7_9PEZI
MAPITSLPAEILLDIFERTINDPFNPHRDTNTDIIHIRLVCRKWRALSHEFALRYFSIGIDSTNRSLWKLGRCLLYDTSLAAQIQELIVRWHRREADIPETHTKRWKWTREDRERIEFYRKELSSHISSATFDAMLEGVNSESLLPFILCFTTNLKELDLNNMESLLIGRVWFADSHGVGSETIRRVLGRGPSEEGFKYIEDEDEDEDDEYGAEDYEDDDYDSDRRYLDCDEEFLRNHMPPEAKGEGALWFHVNIGTPGNYLPGLRQVTHLRNGFNSYNFVIDSLSGWSAKYIAPLLFLPNLEFLEIKSHATIGGTIYGDKNAIHRPLPPSFEPYRGLKSKVKTLELWDGRLRLEDYDAIAELTGNLTDLQIDHSEHHNPLPDPDLAYIANTFRAYNKETLTLHKICINDWFAYSMPGINFD